MNIRSWVIFMHLLLLWENKFVFTHILTRYVIHSLKSQTFMRPLISLLCAKLWRRYKGYIHSPRSQDLVEKKHTKAITI